MSSLSAPTWRQQNPAAHTCSECARIVEHVFYVARTADDECPAPLCGRCLVSEVAVA